MPLALLKFMTVTTHQVGRMLVSRAIKNIKNKYYADVHNRLMDVRTTDLPQYSRYSGFFFIPTYSRFT